jgi:transposase
MIAQGKSLEEAAWTAGVGQSTVYRWVALGREGDPRFDGLAEAVREARSAAGTSRAVVSLLGGRFGRRF